jgi:hypothetical protein
MIGRFSDQPTNSKFPWIVGALGFAWAFVVVMPAAVKMLDRPSAEDQEPYKTPGVMTYGDFAQIVRRMKGGPAMSVNKEDKFPCWGAHVIWQDQDTLVRGSGPKNGSTATFWIAQTVNSQVFLGRYSIDVWFLTQAGTGAIGFTTDIQQVENARLIERIPPPAPAPPGWRAILPGHCVLGEAKPIDDAGTVGRFLIDLPGKTTIFEKCGPESKWFPIDCYLTYGGKEVTHVPIEGAMDGAFYYQTQKAGRYELTVRRTDPLEARKPDRGQWARFSVMVTWGAGSGGTFGCGPAIDQSKCFGDNEQ